MGKRWNSSSCGMQVFVQRTPIIGMPPHTLKNKLGSMSNTLTNPKSSQPNSLGSPPAFYGGMRVGKGGQMVGQLEILPIFFFGMLTILENI